MINKNYLIGGTIFALVILAMSMFFYSYRSQEQEPVQQQEEETIVPFYQNILLLVKYNKTMCPDLMVNHSNINFPEGELVEIQQVKNISQEVNYAELGQYDTNNQEIMPLVQWVNANDCEPEAILISNTDFISLLLDLGVPVDREDNTTSLD